jgi:hypothetical protein
MKTVSFLEAGVARRRIPRFVRRFQPRYELPAFAVLRPGNPAAVPTGGVSQSSPFSPPQRGEDAEAMRGSLLAEPGPAAARRFCAHTKTRRAKFSVLPQGVLRRPAPLHPTPPPPGLRRLRMTVEPELSGSGSVSGSCDSATLRLCDFATLRLCDSATLRLCDFATLRLCDFATTERREPSVNPNRAKLTGVDPLCYTPPSDDSNDRPADADDGHVDRALSMIVR